MRKNKLCVFIHFVWATWDRHPWITEEIERDLYRYLSAVCEDDGCEVLAVGGMPDHVHLLVSFPNTLTLAELMQHVKGGSSRLITQKLLTGVPFHWQGSYGAFSVSAHDKEKVIRYILNQKQHHADNTLWPEAEKAEIEQPIIEQVSA
ncbi:MAG: IS200/IS605 family transposase [Armatimonadetes bacterium]|nr:IS200/IS605 family transposase [Armatimonadota bacterium]